MSQRTSISRPNYVCVCPPPVELLFLGGWWQDLHFGHRKTLHSANPTNTKKTENPLHGSTSCEAALCRASHQMMEMGQSLRDPYSLVLGRKSWGNFPGSDCSGMWRSEAEVSSMRLWPPQINLRRSLWLGA